jgi:hypothetical protein
VNGGSASRGRRVRRRLRRTYLPYASMYVKITVVEIGGSGSDVGICIGAQCFL